MSNLPRRMWSILLTCAMLLTLLPVTALAAATENCSGGPTCTEHVAAIGTTHYDTLVEAVTAAQSGDTIILLANCSAEDIVINKGIILDLNGKTVTAAGGSGKDAFYVMLGGDLNLTGSGAIAATGLTRAFDVVGNTAAATWDATTDRAVLTVGSDVTVTTENELCIWIGGKGAVVNLYGSLTAGQKNPVVQGNGTNNATTNNGGTEINIYPGAKLTSTSVAMYLPQSGTTNISGGTVEGYAAIGIKSGTLNITGGTVKGTANDTVLGDEHSATNGIAYDGSAIVIDSYIGYAGEMDLNISEDAVIQSAYSTVIREIGNDAGATNVVSIDISGGTLTGGTGMDCVEVRDVTAKTVSITGGTFSSNVEQFVPTGYQCADNQDGTYTVSKIDDQLVVEGKVDTSSGTTTVSGTLGGVFNTGTDIAGNVDGGTNDSETDVEGDAVTVDLTTDGTSAKADTTTLTVQAETAATLDGADSLTVLSDAGSVELPQEAMAKISAAGNAGSPVTIEVVRNNVTAESGVAASYSVSVTDESGANLLPNTASETNGTITITVDKPTNAGGDLQAWYVYGSGSAKSYVERLDMTETAEGQLAIEINHLSTVELLNGAPGATSVASATSGTETKYYNTLTEAITALPEGGTVTLLQDITDANVGALMNSADTIRVPDGKSITIIGNGKSITLTPQRADGRAQVFSIPEGSSLTLDNVNLTINGLTAAGANGYGDAFDVWGTLHIYECPQVTIQGVTSAFTMQGGSDAEVNIINSALTAENIRGNFSNGGTWYIMGSTVGIDGCGNNALSVNKLQVSESDVTINNVGYRGIIITDTETTNGSLYIGQGATVTLKDCCNTTDDNVASIYADGVAVKMDRNNTNLVTFIVDKTSKLDAGEAKISLSTNADSSVTIEGEVIGTIVSGTDSIVAIAGSTGYPTLAAALTAASQYDLPVYLVANATLSTAISQGVTLVVPNGKVLTVGDLTTVAGSEGAIQVYAGGTLKVDGQDMIGSGSANISLTEGSVLLSKTGSLQNDNLALQLDFSSATAEIPAGSRWTTVKNVEFGGNIYQVPMNVTFDEFTVLTVNSTGGGSQEDDFRVANGSTLTNHGRILVNGAMTISSEGRVTGGGSVEVASGGLLAVRTGGSATGKLDNAVTNQGTLVWDGTDATGLTVTVTLASGGKVYSQCDLSAKLTGDKRALSDKRYGGVDYAYAWEYYDPSSSTGGGGGGGVTTYAITLPSDVANGTVTASSKTASKGTTVTLTVTPDAGYELDKLTVTDASGSAIALTKKSDTQYTFSMPGSKVTVAVSFQEIVEAPANPFTDVEEGSFYYDAVLWAVDSGVTNGTSATTFSPDATLTRAEMVTFLWRAHGSPEVTGANPFTDVEEGSFYYDAVLWAVANGITNGTTATTFSPEDPVTRAQAVTFQWRAAGSPAVSGGTFADVPADTWFTGAVAWAVEGGITVGTGGNFFSPEAPVSRAQAVTFLYRELA